MVCCQCGHTWQRRYTLVTRRVEGHGPYWSARVSEDEPYTGPPCTPALSTRGLGLGFDL